MQKRQQPVITVLDARPMSETGFREAPPASPSQVSKDSTGNGHVIGNQDDSKPPKRPGPPARPPSIYQSHQDKIYTKNDESPQSCSPPLTPPDASLPPRPAPRPTRPQPEGAESPHTHRAETSSPPVTGQTFSPCHYSGTVQLRRPPIGGTPPPLPRKSPSMGNLSTVGLPSAGDTEPPKPQPRASMRLSRNYGSVNNVSVGPEKPAETAAPQVRKPTIIRPKVRKSCTDGDLNKKTVDTSVTPDTGSADTDAGSVFGVKLKSTVHTDPEPSAPNTERSSTVVSPNHGWGTADAQRKPPPVKPKPALLPKPALKPKPSVRAKPSTPEKSTDAAPPQDIHGDDSKQRSEEPKSSAPAWMPKLKPAVLPKSDKSAEEFRPAPSSQEEHRKPGPVPMKATYRPTIIRASRHSVNKEQDTVKATENKEQDRVKATVENPTPPASSVNTVKDAAPQTRRKPTIIRPKSTVKTTDDSPAEPRAPHMRGAMSMPNIAQSPAQSQLKPLDPSSMISATSQEEGENSVNENLESDKTSLGSNQDDLDKPYPINYDCKPMTKKVPPAKPPPPRPSSGPRRTQSLRFKDDAASGSSNLSKQTRPPRPGAPSKPTRSRPMSMPPNYSANVGSLPPKLPGRPGPGHPLYHYVVNTPHGIAVFDYTAAQQDELSVKTGDVIELLKWVDSEWIYGRNVDKEGMLPLNFLEIVEPLPESAQHANPHQTAGDHPDGATITEPHCVARFGYDGGEDGDLCFAIGDTIRLVERVSDEWLRGELRGKTGIFPVEFVQIGVDLPQTGKAAAHLQDNPDDVVSTAMYPFSGEPNELCFEIGDRILVLSRVDQDWLHGELRGKRGNFPAGFIEHIPPSLPMYKSESSQPSPTSPKGPTTYCVALYPFDGEGSGDLVFREGERIELFGEENADWFRGSLTGREGVFPKGFVKVIDPDDEATPPRPSSVSSAHSAQSLTSREQPPQPVPMAEALFDFPGEQRDDLPFTTGDHIELVSSQDQEWLKGRLGGREGVFPAVFVKILVPLPEP